MITVLNNAPQSQEQFLNYLTYNRLVIIKFIICGFIINRVIVFTMFDVVCTTVNGGIPIFYRKNSKTDSVSGINTKTLC